MGSNNDKYEFTQLLELAKKYAEEIQRDSAENPKSDTIQVVVVEPRKKPYRKTIPNTLDAMSDLVGGYIEIVTIGETKKGAQIAITLNEEGKYMDLPLNRLVEGFDILFGTFFITAFNMQGDNISLDDRECFDLIYRFAKMKVIL
jgi:hypothetical protein